MSYFTPDVPLDLYAEPRHQEIEIVSITEQAFRHLSDNKNWIPIGHLNANNYGNLISEIIPTNIVCGLYSTFRIDVMSQDVVYNYNGSSSSVDSGINARFRKKARSIFGHNLKTDRKLQYADTFVHKFGRNLTDTFVSFYELPYNIRKIPQHQFDVIEMKVRAIENNIISAFKIKYGLAVCANKGKPVSSKLSEAKKRQRAQNDVIHELSFD